MHEILSVLIDSLQYASWLFVIAVGLTLVYGVMKILNVAHGALYALGAYATASFVGFWFTHGYAPLGSYAALLAAALVVGIVAGALIERGLLRFMYQRDETVLMLATYALFLILEDLMKLVWGVESYYVSEPYGLLGNVEFAGMTHPVYSFAIVLVALVVGGALAWILNYTRVGRLLLVVIHDRELARAVGIDVERFYLVTFSAGATLAAIGGAITAPTISVVPGLGVDVIVLAFAVVVTGGLGSLAGAAIGALIVGVARSLAVHYWPEAELFSIYIVMALVLIFRPMGLLAAAQPRRI